MRVHATHHRGGRGAHTAGWQIATKGIRRLTTSQYRVYESYVALQYPHEETVYAMHIGISTDHRGGHCVARRDPVSCR
jgi:hypothetical protein